MNKINTEKEDRISEGKTNPSVFLIGFTPKYLVNAAYLLQAGGIGIAYWVGSKKYFIEAMQSGDFPQTDFHHNIDAMHADPASGVEMSLFPPANEKLLAALSPYEAQVLAMMTELDHSHVSFEQRRRLYYEYVRYWDGVLEHYKPDALFFNDIPHLAYAFVLYQLAKLHGIKTVMHTPLRGIADRLIFFDDFLHYGNLVNAYRDAKRKAIELKDLGDNFRLAYEMQHDKNADSRPIWQKTSRIPEIEYSLKSFPGIKRIMRNIIRGTFLKTAHAYIAMLFSRYEVESLEPIIRSGFGMRLDFYKWKKIRDSFKREYKALETFPDFSKKYVYIPLHNQPERSTSAMGGYFTDQIHLVETVAHALPEDWVIYVKENSLQWKMPRTHLGRYSGYYHNLVKIPNVFLVPAETSSFDLIDNSQAVATITSTAGWEAILRGKPALVFGAVWFMHCDDAFRVKNSHECREAFLKIKNGYIRDAKEVFRFLYALERVSVRGHYRRNVNKQEEISDEENARFVTDAYLKELGFKPK